MPTSPTNLHTRQRPRRKEMVFVRDAVPGASFRNVTDLVGTHRDGPRAAATCAMRVSEETVAFSLLHLSRNVARKLAQEPLSVPRHSLSRLERHARHHAELATGQVHVEVAGHMRTLDALRDEHGTLRLETSLEADGTAQDNPVFELSTKGTRVTVHLISPVTSRVIAVGFVGHLGRPDSCENLVRAASLVLASMCDLPEFRLLAGIESVTVPSPTTQAISTATPSPTPPSPTAPGDSEDCTWTVPVWLYTDAPDSGPPQPVPGGSGIVQVRLHLDNADPTTGVPRTSTSPEGALADNWGGYEAPMQTLIAEHLREHLGAAQLQSITFDITLGTLSAQDRDALIGAMAQLPAVMLTPTRAQRRP